VTTTSPAHAVSVEDVTKTYGQGRTAVTAIQHITLSLAEGEFLGVVGPSGSGKTTLLSIIGGLLRPTEGRVSIGGVELTALSHRQQAAFRVDHIGFVFQSFNLVPFLTARENLTLMASIGGHATGRGRSSASSSRRRADQLLDELGLAERGGNLPEQLSGGERQRVAIGRALMNDPDVILVDEPTANLDGERGRQVVELIAREVKTRNKSGIMVTHDTRVLDYVDRAVALVDGQLSPQPVAARGEA
jgi:putative ABC transport system ATP-binding protein